MFHRFLAGSVTQRERDFSQAPSEENYLLRDQLPNAESMRLAIGPRKQKMNFMAEVLEREDEELRQREEELIAEEQRRLEEAALLADQNFITSPQADAEAAALQAQFNQQSQPTAYAPPIPEAYTANSAQYQQEVARAQRGSGFVNADVGPGGNVITPGYDPERDPRAIIARREAENLQRNSYVSSLVNDGATYAEALRAGLGRFPNTGDPALMLRAEKLALESQPFTPRSVNLNGTVMDEVSRGRFSRRPPAPFVGGKTSEATKVAADNLKNQIAALRKKIAPSSSGIVLLSPEEVSATEAQITQKERERVALFETPESNPQVDQPSWLKMRNTFNAPPPISEALPTTPTPTKADPASIREQFRTGKLSREEAKEALQALGFE